MNPVDHPHGGGEGRTSESTSGFRLGELPQKVSELEIIKGLIL